MRGNTGCGNRRSVGPEAVTKPRALDARQRAYAQRVVDLNFMAVDLPLASLRAEPRFFGLKRRTGL
jgi:hypothetical protein